MFCCIKFLLLNILFLTVNAIIFEVCFYCLPYFRFITVSVSILDFLAYIHMNLWENNMNNKYISILQTVSHWSLLSFPSLQNLYTAFITLYILTSSLRAEKCIATQSSDSAIGLINSHLLVVRVYSFCNCMFSKFSVFSHPYVLWIRRPLSSPDLSVRCYKNRSLLFSFNCMNLWSIAPSDSAGQAGPLKALCQKGRNASMESSRKTCKWHTWKQSYYHTAQIISKSCILFFSLNF